jgi:aspartyl-tRNA(Asn)/glutamyl-tRNA(Gln) amidotransferase subunit B
MAFETVIGLEVHAQLKTNTKIFCGCSTEFGAAPNENTCPVCLGMPGMLPVLNKKVVEYAMRMGLATHCSIAHLSRFARKNYFYPDLPKGYQISQYELPLCHDGYVDIEVGGEVRRIGINRIHMEEDAGKLTHDPNRPVSFVDFNRTGVPLIEIVSEPDLRSPEEAGAYLRNIRSLLRYLRISDGNMEEGSFRCDAKISIRPKGESKLGTRAELKNMNSFRNVEKALHYEIERQKELVSDGGQVVQETRLYDAEKDRTFSMRGKEEAHDYRYFPDPDLLPLVVDDAWIETVRSSLPELPGDRKKRFMEAFGHSGTDAEFLTGSRELADYFEACLAEHENPKLVTNWVTGQLMAFLNTEGKTIEESPISAGALAGLLKLLDEGVISGKIAKTVFEEMTVSGKSAKQIVEEKGLVQVQDESAIESAVDKVLAANPQEVEAFQGGKTKLMGFFVGQVMRETKGKANPKIVNELLNRKLKG